MFETEKSTKLYNNFTYLILSASLIMYDLLYVHEKNNYERLIQSAVLHFRQATFQTKSTKKTHFHYILLLSDSR